MVAMHYGTKPSAENPVAAAAAEAAPISELAARITAPPPPPYMAHAGGIHEGQVYTNSIAALDNSYRDGHRLMEVDLHRTADYHTVLLHDWDGTVSSVFGLMPGQRTLTAFLAESTGARHQPARLSDFTAWAARHPDVQVVLDTKVNHMDILREIAVETPNLRSRFVPYIYSFGDYEAVRRLGYANISLLIRPDQYTPAAVLEFAKHHRLHSIAMQPEVLRLQSPELKEYAPIYCWTINDPAAAASLRPYGLYGVITDTMKPPQTSNTEPNSFNVGWIDQ